MTKWAIYKNKVGLYAKEYIDTLEGCKDLLGGYLITEDRLPIVVNNAGGRCSFYPVENNFVEIVEAEDGKEPLTREQCFPKNSDEFLYGWISPSGDTYNTDFEGHYRAAVMICNELYGKEFRPESKLEETGWIKISRPAPYTPENYGKTAIYSKDLMMTKAQADTLVDLGFSNDENFRFMMEYNSERW
ncbi:MAG: hypothetical protein LIO54_08280 [Oscillospiraceae bacterium]|nr:hypothetical protein [Oscillospiraceae bacterium]